MIRGRDERKVDQILSMGVFVKLYVYAAVCGRMVFATPEASQLGVLNRHAHEAACLLLRLPLNRESIANEPSGFGICVVVFSACSMTMNSHFIQVL